jgi:hypothetical protein
MFVLLVGLIGSATAGAEPLRWIIDTDLNGRATLVGEKPVSEQGEQEVFPNLSRALAGTPEGRAYYEYVKALVELRSSEATAMFTTADGSRARFARELSDQPKRHDGWKDVERVTAKMVFNWGPYKVIPIAIRMKGDPKEYLWREALFCTSGCAMSNAFNILDSSREKFTVMMGSGTTALVNESWGSLGEKAQASGLMNLDDALFFRPQWIAGALSRQYPLIAFPKVDILSGEYYPFFDESAQNSPGGAAQTALDVLETFLTDLRSVDLTTAPDGSYAQKDLETVLGAHWRDFKPGQIFRFFERPEDDEPMMLAKYAQHPFSNQLSKWDGVHPVAAYESKTGVFLFVYPVIKETLILNMQVLSFEREETDPARLALSLGVQRSDAGRLLMSGEMVEYLDRRTESVLASR